MSGTRQENFDNTVCVSWHSISPVFDVEFYVPVEKVWNFLSLPYYFPFCILSPLSSPFFLPFSFSPSSFYFSCVQKAHCVLFFLLVCLFLGHLHCDFSLIVQTVNVFHVHYHKSQTEGLLEKQIYMQFSWDQVVIFKENFIYLISLHCMAFFAFFLCLLLQCFLISTLFSVLFLPGFSILFLITP